MMSWEENGTRLTLQSSYVTDFIRLATNESMTWLPSNTGKVKIKDVTCEWSWSQENLCGADVLFLEFIDHKDLMQMYRYIHNVDKPWTMDDRLNIQITGKAGAGKTTLAILIKYFLQTYCSAKIGLYDDDYTEEKLAEKHHSIIKHIKEIKFNDIVITQDHLKL